MVQLFQHLTHVGRNFQAGCRVLKGTLINYRAMTEESNDQNNHVTIQYNTSAKYGHGISSEDLVILTDTC